MTAPTRRRYPGSPPPQEFRIEVGRGLVTGVSGIRKFGHNAAVGNAAYEDIWEGGGTYPFPTSALAVRIKVGGNAADDTGGAGAQKVTVIGLDETWAAAQEDIVTAGASASAATTTKFIRVFRVYVSEVGTYGGANTAAIDIETTGGTTLATIAAGAGQTRMAIYTIPLGKTGHLSQLEISAETNKTFDMKLVRRGDAGITAGAMGATRIITEFAGLTDRENRDYCVYPEPLPAKTDIWLMAKEAAGTGKVTAELNLWLVDD